MNKNPQDLRKTTIYRNFTDYPSGSVMICQGRTRVLCTASVEDKVPSFLSGSGRGWLTAEYSMLPGSTLQRKERDIKKGRQDPRSVEIGRLIGRSLRASLDLSKLGEHTITIDCDVLQADGGTRCASITGGMVALSDSVARLMGSGALAENPILHKVAAVSVGICAGVPTLDLDYEHDSSADVDMNVVMTDGGGLVEIQGTAESAPFARDKLLELLDLAAKGIRELFKAQESAAVLAVQS